MKKGNIVVPKGMLEKARRFSNIQDTDTLLGVLSNALHWLAENPIIPTDADMKAWASLPPITDGRSVMKEFAEWWQRRMFLAPEPECEHLRTRTYPAFVSALEAMTGFGGDDVHVICLDCGEKLPMSEDIKDLLKWNCDWGSNYLKWYIIEAYRRGRESR